VLELLAKRIPAGQRFRPRIDMRVADAFVLRPGWNQTPAHELHRGLVAVVVIRGRSGERTRRADEGQAAHQFQRSHQAALARAGKGSETGHD